MSDDSSGADLISKINIKGTYTYKGSIIRPIDNLSQMGITNESIIYISNDDVENITIRYYAMRHHKGVHFEKKIIREDIYFLAVDKSGTVIGVIIISGPDASELLSVIDEDKDRITIYHNKNLKYVIFASTHYKDIEDSQYLILEPPEILTNVFQSSMYYKYKKISDYEYIF